MRTGTQAHKNACAPGLGTRGTGSWSFTNAQLSGSIALYSAAKARLPSCSAVQYVIGVRAERGEWLSAQVWNKVRAAGICLLQRHSSRTNRKAVEGGRDPQPTSRASPAAPQRCKQWRWLAGAGAAGRRLPAGPGRRPGCGLRATTGGWRHTGRSHPVRYGSKAPMPGSAGRCRQWQVQQAQQAVSQRLLQAPRSPPVR